jgi:hypothetical protein
MDWIHLAQDREQLAASQEDLSAMKLYIYYREREYLSYFRITEMI